MWRAHRCPRIAAIAESAHDKEQVTMKMLCRILKCGEEMAIKKLSAFVIAAALFGAANVRAESTAAELCIMDLEALPGFLLENDTGAKFHVQHLGQKHFDDALATARKA